jgi:Replication protein C C-terminal region
MGAAIPRGRSSRPTASTSRDRLRHAEFVRPAEAAREERELTRKLRRRATIARNGIAQILETATEYGFQGEEWSQLAHDTQGLASIPRLMPYLPRPNPTWPELVNAADWLRHDLDVSKPLWGEACLAMGRVQAAIALAVVSTKDPAHFRTTAGGYFHGMVAKAKAGELNLDRTLWAMWRAAEPTPRPKTARERGLRRPPAPLWD